ncbi:hypothetical protein JTB14_031697 [Gonioctena quinquepunctata]|nr:hypothetical protein JTB14_031697 [Gonioctena quinquepunctata]
MIELNGDEESEYTLTNVKEIEIFSCSSCPYESENIDELDEHILLYHENVEAEDSDDDGFHVVCEEVAKTKNSESKKNSENNFENVNKKNDPSHVPQGNKKVLKHEYRFHFSTEDNSEVVQCRKRAKKEKIGVFTCGWCNYSTTTKSDMKEHRRTHSNMGPSTVYQCSQCPYETKRKNDMPKHMLGHCTNVELYACPECPYKTKRKCDLPKHLLCHKPPDSVPLYKCDYCPYVTKRKGDLPKHIMNHKERSELPLFKCTECEYVSKRMNDLHKHMLVHCDRHIAGVFKCLKCAYASDKVVRFSKHVQSKCRTWEDPISLEHLMLEDILASADQEDLHVVLDPDEGQEFGGVEEEEYRYIEHQGQYQYVEQTEGEGEYQYMEGQEVEEEGVEIKEYVQYFAADGGVEEYVQGDENGQDLIHGLAEDVLESEIIEESFVPINEQDVTIEQATENQGVFRINLGEFSVDVPPGTPQ